MRHADCKNVCTPQIEIFQVKNKPVIVSRTDADISSNAGFLALSQIDRKMGLTDNLVSCLTDATRNRLEAVHDEDRIHHSIGDLLRQRVYQMGLGYEDGLDANDLRFDSILQLSVGKQEALGSQPMMSRLENWISYRDLYRVSREFVTIYARHFHKRGEAVVIHIDSTNDPVHGQLGLFNGYYEEYCFHPLLITEERSGFPFGIILRDGDVASADDAKLFLRRLIRWLREEIPGVSIVVKGDCSFGISELMNFFDANEVDYILGLSGNSVLYRQVEELQQAVFQEYEETKQPLQRFMSFAHKADPWEREHPVVAKVEHTVHGLNVRFVVSSMTAEEGASLFVSYHKRAKGIEAVIEQLKNGLRMDKTACHKKLPNQVRYFECAVAWILHLKLMDKVAKKLPDFPTVHTLIQKILKIAGIVIRSTRRFLVQISTRDPNSALLLHALQT